MAGMVFLSSTRYRYPLDPGVEAKFSALADLAEVTVVAFADSLRPRRFVRPARFFLLPRMPIAILRYVTFVIGGILLATWAVFRTGAGVLIAQSPYEAIVGSVAKRLAAGVRRRVVLVVESHGDFERIGPLWGTRSGPWASLRISTVRWGLRHADVLRTTSARTGQQLDRWVVGRPVVQFPAWMDLDLFAAAGGHVAARAPEILYAGALIPLKGVHVLLDAFAILAREVPSARLMLAGAAHDRAYVVRLRARAAEPDLAGRVVFLGFLPPAQLAARMARSTICVLPSLSEGFGRVVVEAMASGTVVVASTVGGIPELVADGQTGLLVPPDDVAALAGRLLWIWRHPEARDAIQAAARAWVRAQFPPDWYREGYARVLEYADAAVAAAHAG